MSQSGPLKSS